MNVHQTMISAIERGDKMPALELLVRLQDALGVPLIPLPPVVATDTAAAVQP